jgi:hypothetical protein
VNITAELGRRRVLAVLGLAAVAAAVALAVVLAARDRGSSRSAGPAEIPSAIEAEGVLSPSIALFGDTVRARVDVTLDRRQVDPDSVRVRADFSPWKRVANAERLRRDGKTTTYLGTTFVLRCLESSCASNQDVAVQEFAPARVTYTPAGGTGSSARLSVPVQWPQLVISARYSSSVAQAGGTPWRADLVSLPAVSYRIAPARLSALLLAGSALLAMVAGAIAYVVLPRRRPPPIPQVEEPPEPVLTPLERAFILLEVSTRVDGAADQRRALELVAGELAERSDARLARVARALAWSPPVPQVEETRGLAASARSALGEELHAHPE